MADFKNDLAGRKFERWTVLSYSHKVLTRSYWNCRCECGAEKAVPASELVRGGSLSCGCLMREKNGARVRKHGMENHPAYRSWKYAKTRCRNPKDTGYYGYGAKGIKFSPEWDSFEAFWRDMGDSWFEGASLDRLDGDLGYEPGNCRWATAKEQANNRSTNRLVETPNGWVTVAEAAEFYGIGYHTIVARIRYGWPHDQLGRPVRPVNRSY